MKPGDMIIWDPSNVERMRGVSGYESGLIVCGSSSSEEKRDLFCANDRLFEQSRFTVLWDCGKLTRPTTAYLSNFRVISNEAG